MLTGPLALAGACADGRMGVVPTVMVEIHVPLSPTPNLPYGAYPYPWIQAVEDFLADLEDQGEVEVFR